MVARCWSWVRGFTTQRHEEYFLSEGTILYFDFDDAIGLFKSQIQPFGTHKLSPFEIVTGFPTYLALASFDPQLIKGKIHQYFKGLIVSIKKSSCFGTAIFSKCILIILKDLKHHRLQPGDSMRKDTSRRTLFNLTGEAHIKYC